MLAPPALRGVAVYGVGSTAYPKETYCKPAKELAGLVSQLGAVPLPLGEEVEGEGTVLSDATAFGDWSVGDMDAEFGAWAKRLVAELAPEAVGAGAGSTTAAASAAAAASSTSCASNDDGACCGGSCHDDNAEDGEGASRRRRRRRNRKKNKKNGNSENKKKGVRVEDTPEVEEDRVNDRFVTMDYVDEDGGEKEEGSGRGCGDGDESALVDIEEVGKAMHEGKKHAAKTA